MTFTATTLRELRALGHEPDRGDKVVEILERAHGKKPKKGGAVDRAARGTRLPDDWMLPEDWKQWALATGLRAPEVVREALRFKNYWTSATGAKGIKLNWERTWQNWCVSTLERAGRPVTPPQAPTAAPAAAGGPETFDDATWRAIAKRVKAGAPWSQEWGPPPSRMDCLMPAGLL